MKKYKYFLEFSKINTARLIGHIDLLKYFERIFIMAELPLKYTNGFNPHPRMQFSSALSLGIESKCELLEFYLSEFHEPERILNILTNLQNIDIPVNRIRYIGDNSEKISLFDRILHTEYSFIFEEINYRKIKELSEKYLNEDIFYSINLKNKVITGKYKDFFEIKGLDNSMIHILIRKNRNIPKIFQIIHDVFNDIYIIPRKEKIFALKNDQIIELFDL
jgi:radical SAM-linked protein